MPNTRPAAEESQWPPAPGSSTRQQHGAVAGAAPAPGGQLLFDLGALVVGCVVRRPSATVKTPYVADVQLLPSSAVHQSQQQQQKEEEEEEEAGLVLAHTPAVDCAGMIVPGSTVYMTAHQLLEETKKETKTSHAVQVAQELREDGGVALVGAHPLLAERIASSAAACRLLPLPSQLQGYSSVLKQQIVGSARFDFALCYDDGSRLLVEVKNMVCADYPQGQVPPQRTKAAVYTSAAQPYSRSALFPHGARKRGSGVVSDRAIKHVHELTQLQQAGRDGEGRLIKCAVLFIVNRCDCEAFRPCHEADMLFACMLHRAQQAGVLVLAHDVCWHGGRALWGKPLPVVFGAGVDGACVDIQHLNRVLEFNATNPRTHWKKQKKNQLSE